MRSLVQLAQRHWWLGVIPASAVLFAVLAAELKAQPRPSDDAQVRAADRSLADAMLAGNKSVARRLLSLEFSFVDAAGKVRTRRKFLADLKGVGGAPASDVTVKIYGQVAMVTGHRQLASGGDVFFLDIWAKQRRAWRALAIQDVALGTDDAQSTVPAQVPDAAADLAECRNPCETIPYRVRSPAEQDIVTTFEAIEKATVAHDADAYGTHVADEFVHYRSGYAPVPKSERMAIIADQKERNVPEILTAIRSMRLWVYGDGAAMTSVNGVPSDPEPSLRIARVWVKRGGRWQMAVSTQTDVQ